MKMTGMMDYLKLNIILPIYASLSILFLPHNSPSFYKPDSRTSLEQIENDVYEINSMIEYLEKKIVDFKKSRIKDIMPESSPYIDSLFAYSHRSNIEPENMAAVIFSESEWNPYATSEKGAKGLMQLMPNHHRLNNPYNPYENMMKGSEYLSMLRNLYKNDVIAYSAYNAGPGKVDEWIRNGWNGDVESIPYKETREFVKRINSVKLKLQTQTYR